MAYYHLEMLISASINRMVTQMITDPNEIDSFREIMDSIVADSNIIYRKLVLTIPISMIISLRQVRLRKFPVSTLGQDQRPVKRLRKLQACVPFLGSFHGHKIASCFQVGMG